MVFTRAEPRAYLAGVRAPRTKRADRQGGWPELWHPCSLALAPLWHHSAAKATVGSLTESEAERLCPFIWGLPTYAELLLYTMRHVQEHAAQLNMLLSRHGVHTGRWVTAARI